MDLKTVKKTSITLLSTFSGKVCNTRVCVFGFEIEII